MIAHRPKERLNTEHSQEGEWTWSTCSAITIHRPSIKTWYMVKDQGRWVDGYVSGRYWHFEVFNDAMCRKCHILCPWENRRTLKWWNIVKDREEIFIMAKFSTVSRLNPKVFISASAKFYIVWQMVAVWENFAYKYILFAQDSSMGHIVTDSFIHIF